MDKITTPMAILISGILIAVVIAFKDSIPKLSIVKDKLADEYLILNHETGEVCWGSINRDYHEKTRANSPEFKVCK